MKAKKRNWKIYGLIMVLLLELFILPVPEAKADLYYTLENGGNLTLVNSAADRKYGYEMAFTDVSLYGVKPKIISSKKSVAKIKNNGGGLFTVIPKKAGTTKIKLTATVNRKKITRKATIKIVKFKDINYSNCFPHNTQSLLLLLLYIFIYLLIQRKED